jgi:uncharacterized protein (AIM24 family)
MPGRPVLVPTAAAAETFAGITYHLDGGLVPALTVEITPDQPVYFEHHIMLWKNPSVSIGVKPIAGAVKRMLAGMPVTEATGSGMISFSRDGAGQIIPLHLAEMEEIHVREHQFLAATRNVDYMYERVRGIANMMAGATGFFIDKFRCHQGEGILWLHGYGNVFEKRLAPNEQIEVEPGAWLYRDASVTMETNVQTLSSGLFGSANMITNRFTGPGRIGIQSMYAGGPGSDASGGGGGLLAFLAGLFVAEA